MSPRIARIGFLASFKGRGALYLRDAGFWLLIVALFPALRMRTPVPGIAGRNEFL